MNVTIKSRKTSIWETFRERVEKKLSKLDRFFDQDGDATVLVTRIHDRDTVEVTIQAAGMIFRAEKTADDRLEALDDVIDALTRQIVKNKTKLEKRLKSANFDLPTQDWEQDQEEIRIVRSKKFVVKPMSPEEAVLQMDLLGHNFFVFRNAESGEINVVYKRHNGDYGLIEPLD